MHEYDLASQLLSFQIILGKVLHSILPMLSVDSTYGHLPNQIPFENSCIPFSTLPIANGPNESLSSFGDMEIFLPTKKYENKIIGCLNF